MISAGKGIVLAVAALLIVGVVFVNSAALGVTGGEPVSLAGILFGRHTLYAAAAMACLVLGSCLRVDSLAAGRGLRSPIPWIALLIVASVVAVHIPGVGKEVNGARRWIALGALSFQPSEFAKWGIPILMAWWCTSNPDLLGRFWRGFVFPMAAIGVICLGIAGEDLGTAALVMAVALVMLLAAGARWVHAVALAPVGLLGFTALVWFSPYRVARILAYLDPYADPRGIGYHIVQSMGAIAGGGLTGRGLGNSVQKFGYLPEGTTDFILAIIAEESGVLGAGLVVGLYALLVWCAAAIVSAPSSGSERSLSPFARLLGLGVLTTVGLQALLNAAVVTGLAPTKGIALPLISRGGTGWMLTAFSLGLLVSMDRPRSVRRSAAEDSPTETTSPMGAA